MMLNEIPSAMLDLHKFVFFTPRSQIDVKCNIAANKLAVMRFRVIYTRVAYACMWHGNATHLVGSGSACVPHTQTVIQLANTEGTSVKYYRTI